MFSHSTLRCQLYISLISFALTGCYHPPYNNFRQDNRTLNTIGAGAAVGAGIGAAVGGAAIGAAIGATTGTLLTYHKKSQQAIINELKKQDIQIIQYGDTITLLVPTDRYYVFNSPRLNDLCYAGLENIVKLVKLYPCTPIYVAAFTDNIGSRHHKKMLTQARADTMLTFLWAHDIKAKRMHAEGYADKHTIGDNQWIHGSAYNRRVEIQWSIKPTIMPPRLAAETAPMK